MELPHLLARDRRAKLSPEPGRVLRVVVGLHGDVILSILTLPWGLASAKATAKLAEAWRCSQATRRRPTPTACQRSLRSRRWLAATVCSVSNRRRFHCPLPIAHLQSVGEADGSVRVDRPRAADAGQGHASKDRRCPQKLPGPERLAQEHDGCEHRH